ncbi:hypothetical protein D3C72_1914390 [compost metagenome]
MVRGCESNTGPLVCWYDDPGIAGEPGPKKPAGAPSAGLNTGSVTRGKTLSAAPYWVLLLPFRFIRLLFEPSTARRPMAARTLGISERMSCPAASASAILICARMKFRSERTMCRPAPPSLASTTGVAAVGTTGAPGCTTVVGCEYSTSVVPWAS